MLDDPSGGETSSHNDRRALDPRRIRTREAILRAAFDLFARRQPEGVSIDELVRAAGISKQSFYNHFTDKDDVARHIEQVTRAEIDALVTEANRGVTDAAHRIAVGLCVYARYALDRPQRAWVVVRFATEAMAAESDVNRPVAADVQAGVAAGRLACFTPETGIAFVLGAGLALTSRVLLEETEEKALISTPQILTLLLRGFGLPPVEAETIAIQATERVVRSKR